MSLWKLQPRAKYRMVWGPDNDGDGVMDSKAGTKDFDLPQIGTVVTFPCASDSSVVVEIDQIGPPSDNVKLLPDPGISDRDLRLAGGKLTVDVHNVGAEKQAPLTLWPTTVIPKRAAKKSAAFHSDRCPGSAWI